MGKGRDRRPRVRRTKAQLEEEREQLHESQRQLMNQHFLHQSVSRTQQSNRNEGKEEIQNDNKESDVGTMNEGEVNSNEKSNGAGTIGGMDQIQYAVENVNLRAIPTIFHTRVCHTMTTVRNWFRTTGNQHRKHTKGSWGWNSLDAPLRHLDMIETPTPEDYLMPKLCRLRFFMPELAFPVSN